jgi:glycosyltransferase EpsE
MNEHIGQGTQKVKISVLMTAYNNAALIGQTIESVLNQTFKDFEIVICDDNSTDSTWEVISRYAEKYPHIKIYRNEKNIGIAENRNKLLSLAQGTYAAMHDNDDLSLPHRLQTQYEYMENNPDVVACGSFLEYFDEHGNHSIRTYPSDDATLRKRFFRDCPIATPSAFLRIKETLQAGGFGIEYKYCDDLDLYFRLAEYGKLANIQQVLVKYRRHANANSIKHFKILENETLAVRYKYAEKLKMSLFDRIYNFTEWISQYIIPSRVKIWLFTRLRNSRL